MSILRHTPWVRHLPALLAALLITGSGYGQESVAQLKQQLSGASDWRLRVDAALRLGSSRDQTARAALERALSDSSPSVRASVAAALQVYADPRSLPCLRERLTDESALVRRQVTTAIRSLETPARRPAFLVEVGEVRVSERVGTRTLDAHVKRVAHHNLGNLPGVVIKGAQPQGSTEQLPILLFDGTLHALRERREGQVFAVSAEVEFVITKLPERLIKGRISGGATVHGEASAPTRKDELERLRKEAVEAATESALRNAERAIRAAAE